MANNTDKVHTRGRLVYIEPNEFAMQKGVSFGNGVKGDNIVWNPEDLNMAVDLQVVIPRRDDCGDNTEFDVNIDTSNSSFMHNFVSLFGGSQIGKDKMSAGDHMLTDSYTDISYNEIRSGYKSDRECLGISSIDIKFDSHFYPMVNMRFTDVRGFSLFMPAEQQYLGELDKNYAYKNFFQAIFHFPYPRFLLTIKGFYGNKVTFILAVNDFKAALNANTGNFDVDISFIGYMYGLYTEIPMSMILCAPYIDIKDGETVTADNIDSVYGSYWQKAVEEGRFVTMDDGVPLPTLLEYLVKYVNVVDNIDYDALTAVNEMVENKQELALLNDVELWTKKYEGVINGNIVKCFNGVEKVCDSSDGKYALLKIKDDRVVVENKLSFNSENNGSYYASIDGNYAYKDKETSQERNFRNEILPQLYSKIKEYNNSESRSCNPIPYPFRHKQEDTNNYLFAALYEKSYDTERLNDFFDYGDLRNDSDVSVNKLKAADVITLFPEVKFNDKIIYKGADGADKELYRSYAVFNKNYLTNTINDYKSQISSQTEGLENDANEEIAQVFTDALGFRLNLENVYRMIFAHIDCFMNALNTYALGPIREKKGNGTRTLNSLGLTYNGGQTDILAKKNDAFVPPFFALYDRDRRVDYPGTTSIGNITAMHDIDEVKFVDMLSDAAKMCGKIYTSVAELLASKTANLDENGNPVDNTENMGWKYSCYMDFLYGTKNPYSIISMSNSDTDFDQVLYMLYLRVINHLIIDNGFVGSHKDKQDFYETELNNIKNAIGDKMSNSMYNKLLEYSKIKESQELLKKLNTNVKNYPWRFDKNSMQADVVVVDRNEKLYQDVLLFTDKSPLLGSNNEQCLILKNVGSSCVLNDRESYESQIENNFGYKIVDIDNSYGNAEIKEDYLGLIYENEYVSEGRAEIVNDGQFEEKYLNIATEYQRVKGSDNNFWYCNNLSNDDIDDTMWARLRNGYFRDIIRDSQYDPDGCEVWNHTNGYDVTNYQLTVASYLLASSLPILDYNLVSCMISYGNPFIQNYKVVALYVGSLIFRARQIRRYGSDVVYYHNIGNITDKWLTEIVDDDNVIHYDKAWVNDDGEGVKVLKCFFKKYKGDADYYFSHNGWEMSNSKLDNLEAFFCRWVTEEFMPIYEQFLANPQVLSEDKVDNRYGFKLHYLKSDAKKPRTRVNQKSQLNTFMCDLVTKRENIFIPHCYNNFATLSYNYTITNDICNMLGKLEKAYADRHEDLLTQTIRETDETNKELKKAMYYSIKNLYDKWICSYGSLDKFTLQTAAEDREAQKKRFREGKHENGCEKEYNNFLYVDSFYNYIGERFMVNPEDLYKLIMMYGNGEANNSVYEFMAEIAEKNKLLMIALPVYTNFYNKSEMVEIFSPHDIYNANSTQTDGFNNTYVIMYTHEASKHLDDISSEEIGYEGDGYDLADSLGKIGDIPAQIYDENTGDKYNLRVNAFGVTYGMQNQSYFTNIAVNMDNPIVTDYSIANQLQLSQTAAHGDIYYPFGIGQNIYSIYSNRSYTCTVTMLGCANIMPLMYFQLNNVPMFKGAYMIISVSHSIQAGHMTTTFTGIRQSKYLQPFNQVIFDLTDLVEKYRGSNSATMGGVTKRKARYNSSSKCMEPTNAMKDRLLNDVNPKFGYACFPKDDDGKYYIPTDKDEMGKFMEDVEINIWKDQTTSAVTSVTVNKGIAKNVKAAFDEIFNAKIKMGNVEQHIIIKTVCGWAWRPIEGKCEPSLHSYGLAIDVNAWGDMNPYVKGRDLDDKGKDTPTNFRTFNHPLVKAMSKNKIGWFYNKETKKFDTMHFSVDTFNQVDDSVTPKQTRLIAR